MACTRLNLFILPFGSCLPFTGESLHPGIPSQMSQHRKPLVEPQYLISGLLVPEKYTRNEKPPRETLHYRSIRSISLPSLSLSLYSSFPSFHFYSYSPFFYISLFLFRRTFSNLLPPPYFRGILFHSFSTSFLFSYFLNYPRGFDPFFLFFSFFSWRFRVLCIVRFPVYVRLGHFLNASLPFPYHHNAAFHPPFDPVRPPFPSRSRFKDRRLNPYRTRHVSSMKHSTPVSSIRYGKYPIRIFSEF